VSFSILLYTYCKIFGINPQDAKHTPLSLMVDMLGIHAEVEKHKADAIENETRRMTQNG
jgi:hypothetical protein